MALRDKQVSTQACIIATAVSAVLAAGGGTAGGAVISKGPVLEELRSEVRKTVRDEMITVLDDRLKLYVTKESALSDREAEREKVTTKLDAIREEMIRLRIAVERRQR